MPKAKYEGIYRSIKKRIEAQDYPYQSLLPSENTLIEEYDCSRNTVRRAIAELIADGYVQAMQGRGVRVIYQPVGKTTFTIGGIETFQETANRNHLQAVTRVIRFETITATEQFAAESGFSEGDELWAVQRVLYLDGKAYQVEQSRVQKTCVLLKLEGIDTVESASALRDKIVSIARADAKLPEGSLFIADLLGLPVYDGETLLGTLAEVMPTPANDVYVVKSEDGQEHLIPSVPDFVLERNLDEGYIRVRLIEGM